jgi:spore coat-associated protein N
MNKATKGAIAAGAAGILLLGGAGTFALWSDTDNVNAGTVSTGVLNLTLDSADNAKWTETATPNTEINLATFEIVPGDSLTYTTTVSVTATGDNLTGELEIAESSFDTAFGALAGSYVTATVAHTAVNGTGIAVDETNENLMTFSESATAYTFDVTITLEFDTDTPNLADQNLDLALPALAVTLEQV